MDETPEPEPTFTSRIKANLTDKRTLGYIALSLALGAAGAGVARKLYLEPLKAIADIRYQSHLCLMKLIDLQTAYHGAHGTYANDLNTLLASAPDGEALREKLKASVDINTLAVIGDADSFRLEANVLDPDRTSIKLRGPQPER